MISIVIPTFKRPDLLKRLLKSIAHQSVLPKELIIVDDASNMEAEYNNVILQFRELFENIIYIVLNKNAGAPTARNIGINKATSTWIALVDDDDEWLPSKLEKQVDVIKNSQCDNLGLVYTWAKAIGQESYIIKHTYSGDVKKQLLCTNFIMSASVMIKKEAIIKSGLFKVGLPSCQDWDMWTRIALNGYDFDVVPEVLAIYHRHGGESIGLSSKAKLGYKIYLEAHWRAIVRYTTLTNWAKKLYLYFSVNGALLCDKQKNRFIN